MKQFYSALVRYLVPCLCLFASAPLFAQFRSAQLAWFGNDMNTSGFIDGYYESLPQNYAGGSAKYPLLVYLHGDESVEDGHTEILENGIPKLIQDGAFPESVTSGNTTQRFIVIAPHYTAKAVSADELATAASELNKAISFIAARYRVNTARIYLTGMSRGGGYTWVYAGTSQANATRLAAIVPVANAASPDTDRAAVIAGADLPVWATHNDADNVVPASNTVRQVELVNDLNPQPEAKLTVFNADGHDSWTATYNPASQRFGNGNIYQWMLQFTNGSEAPLPVTLTAYKAVQSASGEVTVTWATASETANREFILERGDGEGRFVKIATVPAAGAPHTYNYIDKAPLPGMNQYRLSQVDTDGTVTYFSVLSVDVSGSRAVLALHPNLITTGTTMKLVHDEQGLVTVTVFSAGGAAVWSQVFQKTATAWQQWLSFPGIAPGRYVLQVQGKTFRHTQPFVKQ